MESLFGSLVLLFGELVAVELQEDQAFQTLTLLFEETRELFHIAEEAFLPVTVPKIKLAVEVSGELIGFSNNLLEFLEMIVREVDREPL